MLCGSWPSQSFANEWMYSGYFKSYLVSQDEVVVNNQSAIKSNISLQNSARLLVTKTTDSGHNFELHYDLSLIAQDQNQTELDGHNSPYRIIDLEGESNASVHFKALQNLDRFNVQMHFDKGDLTLGRQAIAFGSARMINPMDTFIPFGLQALNTEYRMGIDGVRYQHYLNDFTILDVGGVVGKDLKSENSAMYVRTKGSSDGNDFELLHIVMDNIQLYGAGLQRPVFDAGTWVELVYLNAEIGSGWRSSLGFDYAMNDQVLFMMEYHFNGIGLDSPADYSSLINNESYKDAGVYLLGKNYVAPSVSVSVNPLLTMSFTITSNLDDQSQLLQMSGEYSWSENQYSHFGVHSGFGKGMDGNNVSLYSEFGAVPLMAYASYAVYF